MKHPETYLVTKDNGPRPAGKPGECFYCHQRIGETHAPECPCRVHTVVVEARIRYVVIEREAADKQEIEFRRNDGSWCADNAFAELEQAFFNENRKEGDPCACDSITFKYIGDATSEQEKRYNITDVMDR